MRKINFTKADDTQLLQIINDEDCSWKYKVKAYFELLRKAVKGGTNNGT